MCHSVGLVGIESRGCVSWSRYLRPLSYGSTFKCLQLSSSCRRLPSNRGRLAVCNIHCHIPAPAHAPASASAPAPNALPQLQHLFPAREPATAPFLPQPCSGSCPCSCSCQAYLLVTCRFGKIRGSTLLQNKLLLSTAMTTEATGSGKCGKSVEHRDLPKRRHAQASARRWGPRLPPAEERLGIQQQREF